MNKVETTLTIDLTNKQNVKCPDCNSVLVFQPSMVAQQSLKITIKLDFYCNWCEQIVDMKDVVDKKYNLKEGEINE